MIRTKSRENISYWLLSIIFALVFCIELIPQGNKGDGILILKNGVVAKSIPSKPYFTSNQTICWNAFDFENDIVEIRHNGGDDGVSIHVNLIHEGVSTKLLFGSNADIDWITLDSGPIRSSPDASDGLYCQVAKEAAHAIKIQNGKIIESECKPDIISEYYK